MMFGFDAMDGDGNATVVIDWNGSDGPNVEGEDQLRVYIVTRTDGLVSGHPVGSVKPQTTFTNSFTLFQDIYVN